MTYQQWYSNAKMTRPNEMQRVEANNLQPTLQSAYEAGHSQAKSDTYRKVENMYRDCIDDITSKFGDLCNAYREGKSNHEIAEMVRNIVMPRRIE